MTAKLILIPPSKLTTESESTETSVNPVPARFSDQPEDASPVQMLKAVELSGSLDFWDAPEEDVYSPEDGDPI